MQYLTTAGERVEIAPRPDRPLRAGRGELRRRERRRQHRHQRTRLVADDRAPRRAAVEQHGPVVGSSRMCCGAISRCSAPASCRRLQRAEQAVEQRAHRGLVGRHVDRLAQLEQRVAGVVGHRAVDGAVRLPVPLHLHQRRMPAACQQPRLVDEGAPAALEGVGVPARAQHHLHAIGAAQRQRVGQVFLDRGPALEGLVDHQVDQPETADAEHALDHELLEPGPGSSASGRVPEGGSGPGPDGEAGGSEAGPGCEVARVGSIGN
jgi:hypothetical protein